VVELADQAGTGDAPAVAEAPAGPRSGTRASPIDRHVSQRIRERRVLTGQTRQQMADLIGVTYQQFHKYEHGMNRLSVGRLYDIARALETPVSYFFEGLEKPQDKDAIKRQRMCLELARNFSAIRNERCQEALSQLARALVGDEQTPAGPDSDRA